MAPGLLAHPSQARRNPVLYLIGWLIYCVVAIREVTYRAGEESLLVAGALLAGILLLMATDPFLFSRLPWYRYPYFLLQTGLIQALGVLPPYEDVWGVLYIFVCVQAYYYLSLPAAITWSGFAGALMVLTLMLTKGWGYGLGLGLTYVAGSVLVVSWELFSGQAEAARRESQALLADLQRAHLKLQAYAAQVEEQAAVRERDRLAHELHDSVGQVIFGISLTAESARLLLDKDPSAASEQIERLQDMTGDALSQMRSLIAQWRPR